MVRSSIERRTSTLRSRAQVLAVGLALQVGCASGRRVRVRRRVPAGTAGRSCGRVGEDAGVDGIAVRPFASFWSMGRCRAGADQVSCVSFGLRGLGFLLALLLFPAGSRGWLHGMALVLVVAWFCVGEVGNSTTGKSVIRCDCADKAWIVSSIDRDAGCDYAGGLARSYKRSPTPPRKPRVATTEARERRARACAGGRVPNPGSQSSGTGKQSCDNGQAAMCLLRLKPSEAGLPHMISHFLTCFPTSKMPQHVG